MPAALIALATPAYAETFDQVLTDIASEHPRIRSAQHLIRAGQADVSAARSSYRPQFAVQTDAGLIGGEGASGSSFAFLPEARVSQLIYDGGRTPAEIRRRRVRVELLGIQERLALSELSQQLAQAWIEQSRALELIEISKQQVAELTKLNTMVEEIASFDRGRGSDVVIVGSRLQQAITTLQSREIALTEARGRIREIAALPVEPEGPVPGIEPYLPVSALECQRRAAVSPAVQIAALQVAENQEAVKGTRNWWLPQLAFEGARISERTADGNTGLFNDFAVRVRASALPFDGGGGRARHESAKASLEASRSNSELTETGLRDQAQRLWVVQAQRKDRLPSLEGLVGRADQAREIVFEQFRISRRTILDVLAYDLERFTVRAQVANERFDILQTQYQLMGVLGEIYPAVIASADELASAGTAAEPAAGS